MTMCTAQPRNEANGGQTRPRGRWAGRVAIGVLAMGVVAVLWALGSALFAPAPVEAQGEKTAEYTAYPLRHKSPTDVEAVLRPMLTGLGSDCRVVADADRNEILVRGPEKAQKIARELIASLDRPIAAAASKEKEEVKTEVKLHRVAHGDPKEVAARLRTQFRDRNDVRIAADAGTGQVAVLAPSAVQSQIAELLAVMDRAAGEGASPGDGKDVAARPAEAKAKSTAGKDDAVSSDSEPPRRARPVSKAAADEPTKELFIRLSGAKAEEVENGLRELLGRRLTPVGPRRMGRAVYHFSDAAGREVELTIDRARQAVFISGPQTVGHQFLRLIRSLDGEKPADGRVTRLVPLYNADPSKVEEAVEAYRRGNSGASPKGAPSGRRDNQNPQSSYRVPGGIQLASYLFQQPEAAAAEAAGPAGAEPPARGAVPPADLPAAKPLPKAPSAKGLAESEDEQRNARLRELGIDVEIETLPDLDVIILRGRPRDVEEVRRMIEEIERLSEQAEPVIEIYPLRHVEGDSVAIILRQVRTELLTGSQGKVTILPLGTPNSLLLIGWGEAVKKAKQLIARLDQPNDARAGQRVFRLQHASAVNVRTAVTQFFTGRSGLGAPVTATSDPRTNSVIVQAAPREMEEVALLIERLDTKDIASTLQTRIFRLHHTLANDVYATLQGAIDAARGGTAGQKAAALELLTVDPNDPKRSKLIKSGVLDDVRVTPDIRLNILIVAAPAANMDLIDALVRQIDSPGTAAQIKVFRIRNGDANAMVRTLQTLVPSQAGYGPQLSVAEGESSMIGLRFSTDMRTNSIIAVGSRGELQIIEALILRLDAQDAELRKTMVHRLKNSPANDVATAVNDFLRSQQQVRLAAPGNVSPFQQLESEVVVVPEQVTNSLILSATPRFFEEISKMITELDAQPKQVMIQVLIAEVSLRDTDEFGIELGLQDSILFDRSVLTGNMTPETNTKQTSTPAGIVTQTQTSYPFATLLPGFNFLGAPLGNGGGSRAMQNAGNVGGQGTSSLGVNRTNNELGFGGLVLAASSESVSVLIRALKESQRMEVLGRPSVTTLDNQPAFIQIGKRVPRITGTSLNQIGQSNQIAMENVGLILGVTPRVSPDSNVVMEIDAEKSELGAESEGIPVSIAEGTVIRSPSINTTMAQTTVSAGNGETIILGGLITKNHTQNERKVPYLGDVPVLGNLFKYKFDQIKRTELLIILTPHVIQNKEDMERLKRVESARMHWCLDDVRKIHGDGEFTAVGGNGATVYPHVNPRGVLDAAPGTPTPADKLPVAPPPPGIRSIEKLDAPVTPPLPADEPNPSIEPRSSDASTPKPAAKPKPSPKPSPEPKPKSTEGASRGVRRAFIPADELEDGAEVRLRTAAHVEDDDAGLEPAPARRPARAAAEARYTSER